MNRGAMAQPGIRRTEDGVEVRLPLDERQVLADLPAGLRAILRGEADSPARARLFPPGSDDPEIEEEYRRLVGDELLQGRLDAVDRFSATIDAGEQRGRLWVIDLDEDEAAAWLSTLNDLRLVLAPLAGVNSESAWDAGPNYTSPESVLLYHLSWLQEELLSALSSGLPDTS